MCGICGCIGKSRNPKATHALMTNLAIFSQERGKEATGFWGAQGGKDGSIAYHKEPVTATEFIQTSMWKKLRSFDPQVLLVHCREPTQSAGSPKENRNNHPHVSADYSVALIHNGRVEEYTKHFGRFNSQLRSKCDSEMILRIFELGELHNAEFYAKKYPEMEVENLARVFGIENVYIDLDKSHFACAVGERHDGTKRSLWLFRNEKRPMFMVDLRDVLGQFFFFSTMSIWRQAVDATPEVRNLIPLDHQVYDLPIHWAFNFSFDAEAKDEEAASGWQGGWRMRKYHMSPTREYGEPDPAPPITDSRPPRQVTVMTKLNEKDEVIDTPQIVTISPEENGEVSMAAAVIVPDVEEKPVKSVIASPNGAVHGPPSVVVTGDNAVLFDDPVYSDCMSSSSMANLKANEFVHDGKIFTEDPEPNESASETTVFDTDRLEELKKDFTSVMSDLCTMLYNAATGGNITLAKYKSCIDDIEQHLADVKSTLYDVRRIES